MYRIIDLSISSRRICFIVLFIFILILHGCTLINKVDVKSTSFPAYTAEKIEQNEFVIANGNDVIGQLAVIRLKKGDTLPDIARHFSLGINEISLANPGVDVWVPETGTQIVLPLNFILPDAPRKGIVINLATMRLFQFKGDKKSLAVSTYPVGIGTIEKPTPMGQAFVERKVILPTWHVPASIAEAHRKKGDLLPPMVPPGPENPLGEYALYLSKSSYLIHGTNKPASIGLKATNGCIRLYPEDIKELYGKIPVNTPVSIINQPYLIGQLNGVVYLEVHATAEEQNIAELKRIFAKLQNIEKKTKRAIDWNKVDKTLAEARGIPVPIQQIRQGSGKAGEIIEVMHPGKLYGCPEVPQLSLEAWYVLAAELRDVADASRLAAIINHQGPPIPARILAKNDTYRVIAGPFNNIGAARNAAKRLKIDLEIDGILIEPDHNKVVD